MIKCVDREQTHLRLLSTIMNDISELLSTDFRTVQDSCLSWGSKKHQCHTYISLLKKSTPAKLLVNYGYVLGNVLMIMWKIFLDTGYEFANESKPAFQCL